MKLTKDWKYIIYISISVGLYAIVQLMQPRQFDWAVTYAHEDKNPYGTFALQELLVKSGYQVSNTYKTLYELKDSIAVDQSIFIVSSSMNGGAEDIKILLNHVHKGGNALVASDYFSGALSDTLGLFTYDNLFKNNIPFSKNDTSSIYFVNPHLDSTARFQYIRNSIHNYIGRIDSVKATVVVRNEAGQPVMVRVDHGKGKLFLSSTPMIFTNIHLLFRENHECISSILAFLNSKKIWRSEYYHLGRMEAGSPLRFILNDQALRWAYYLSIFSLITFILFEAKRRQRIIPVIKPLANSSMEFVYTLGNLYFQKSDHKNMAEKKILFFYDQVRTQYSINLHHNPEEACELLARKSGNSETDVRQLLKTIDAIQKTTHLNGEELKRLNSMFQKFWRKEKGINPIN